jgi:flagellar secretion chaperone FliS
MIYARRGLALAQNQYQETDLVARVESASPHALVALMYDQLIDALDVMAAMLVQGRTIGQDRHSQRAQTILLALQTSLDFEKGGGVAHALGDVYRAMSAQLQRAILASDAAILGELRDGIKNIADSWNKIVA